MKPISLLLGAAALLLLGSKKRSPIASRAPDGLTAVRVSALGTARALQKMSKVPTQVQAEQMALLRKETDRSEGIHSPEQGTKIPGPAVDLPLAQSLARRGKIIVRQTSGAQYFASTAEALKAVEYALSHLEDDLRLPESLLIDKIRYDQYVVHLPGSPIDWFFKFGVDFSNQRVTVLSLHPTSIPAFLVNGTRIASTKIMATPERGIIPPNRIDDAVDRNRISLSQSAMAGSPLSLSQRQQLAAKALRRREEGLRIPTSQVKDGVPYDRWVIDLSTDNDPGLFYFIEFGYNPRQDRDEVIVRHLRELDFNVTTVDGTPFEFEVPEALRVADRMMAKTIAEATPQQLQRFKADCLEMAVPAFEKKFSGNTSARTLASAIRKFADKDPSVTVDDLRGLADNVARVIGKTLDPDWQPFLTAIHMAPVTVEVPIQPAKLPKGVRRDLASAMKALKDVQSQAEAATRTKIEDQLTKLLKKESAILPEGGKAERSLMEETEFAAKKGLKR